MSRTKRATSETPALLLFTLLFCAPPCPCVAVRSSSLPPHSAPPAPSADADLLRDAPLYPPLENYDSETPHSLPTNSFTSNNPTDQYLAYDDFETLQSKGLSDSTYLKTPEKMESQSEYTGKFNYDESRESQNIDFFNEELKTGVEPNFAFDETDTVLEFTNIDDVGNQLADGSSSDPFFDLPNVVTTDYKKARHFKTNLNDTETRINEGILENPEYTATVEDNIETLVQHGEEGGKDRRRKRSTSKSDKPTRVKTGDTILNIRGALRDAIGDAGAMSRPPGGVTGGSTNRASSLVDAFVIRPDSTPRNVPREPPTKPLSNQAPKNEHEHELLVIAHSRVRVPCDLSNITNVRWFKDKEQVPVVEGPVEGEDMWRESRVLVIARAAPPHAASWRCAGLNSKGNFVSGKPVRLLIYERVRAVYLAVDGRRLDAGNTWVPVRDKTLLEVHCVSEGGVPPPELTWRLLAAETALDHRPYLRIHQTNYSIDGVSSSRAVVTASRELHNATLHCEASQRSPPSIPQATVSTTLSDILSAKLEIRVTYPPSFVISRWPGFGVALVAGGAAALRCDVDANPPAKAYWLRDDVFQSSSPPPPEEGETRGSATLRWAALRAEHAGWYRCRASWLDAEYSSIGYYFNVLYPEDGAPPPPQAEPTEHQTVEVPVGGNAQLHCPKGTVGCWWRHVDNGQSDANTIANARGDGDASSNASAAWSPTGGTRAHGVLAIKDALYQDGGEYRCVGASAADVERTRELKRVTVRVNGGVTATAVSAVPTRSGWRLQCGACGRALKVMWLVKHRLPQIASLSPDFPQHCWRAELNVTEPDEVWCVAVSGNGGAAAVFPARAPSASPAPSRHSVKVSSNGAVLVFARAHLVLSALLLLLTN